MTKYSLDFKLEAVRTCLSSKEGKGKIATSLAIDYAMLRRWVAAYKAHGTNGLSRQSQAVYPIVFKSQVVQAVLDGSISINGALAKYNIPSYRTLQVWVRLYNEGGIDALKNKPRGRPKMSKPAKSNPMPEKALAEMTREELLEELEYRRAEVAYLKKLDALIQSRKSAAKTKRGS